MEGDEPISVSCLSAVHSLLYMSRWTLSYVAAVTVLLSGRNSACERLLKTYAKACVSTYSYVKEKFDSDLRPILALIKAACYISPSK